MGEKTEKLLSILKLQPVVPVLIVEDAASAVPLARALVAGGSDWPVSESPNPLEGMQGLVTRADPLRRAPGVLWPEQAITPDEALEAFTISAARAMGIDHETGSLTPGKSADFVILDRDAVGGDPDAMIDARVVETWFAGRRVFAA